MPVSRAQNGLRLKKMSAQTKKEETCHQMTTHAIPAMHLNRHRRYVYGLVLRSNVRFCYSNGLTQCECMKDTMLYLDYRLFGGINFHEKLADFHTYHSNFNESSITKQFKNQNLKLFSLFPSIPAGKKILIWYFKGCQPEYFPPELRVFQKRFYGWHTVHRFSSIIWPWWVVDYHKHHL